MITKQLVVKRDDRELVGSSTSTPTLSLYRQPVEPPFMYRLHLDEEHYVVLPFGWDAEIEVVLDQPAQPKKVVKAEDLPKESA